MYSNTHITKLKRLTSHIKQKHRTMCTDVHNSIENHLGPAYPKQTSAVPSWDRSDISTMGRGHAKSRLYFLTFTLKKNGLICFQKNVKRNWWQNLVFERLHVDTILRKAIIKKCRRNKSLIHFKVPFSELGKGSLLRPLLEKMLYQLLYIVWNSSQRKQMMLNTQIFF